MPETGIAAWMDQFITATREVTMNIVQSQSPIMDEDLKELPYSIERPLGGGRYADVYLAKDSTGKRVIKLARKEAKEAIGATDGVFFAGGRWFVTGGIGNWSPDPNEILEKEAQVLRQVKHPALVKLLGQEKLNGQTYLILEHIEGKSWRQALNAGELSLEHYIELVKTLTELQSQLPIHGDLKPENLILNRQGETRIIDPSCGMTHIGLAGQPERLLTSEWYNPLLRNSDLPALGALAIEVLTGHQAVLLAGPTRPLREVGPQMASEIETAKKIGQYDRYELLLRMPLPSELNEAIPTELETIALRCLGIRRDGEAIERCETYRDIKELYAAICRYVY
jgi:serine/threonine protein kinase